MADASYPSLKEFAAAPTIYHGTPMTPRAALLNVCPGRAMCVSFYRPDDVEVVEAISPAILYDNGAFSFWQQALRAGNEWAEERDWMPFLSVAGTAAVSSRPLGGDPRHAGGAEPAQRCAAERLAVRTEGRASLAHGRPDRAAVAAVRAIRPGLPWVDRQGACGLSCVSGPDGQCGAAGSEMCEWECPWGVARNLAALNARTTGKEQ